MVITDIQIKLVPPSEDKLLAFACITLDNCFVVRDIKVIRGRDGLFIAMPSRKVTDRCRRCGAKNHLQASYCNRCGTKQVDRRTQADVRGRTKLHVDIAHPINSRCREVLQAAVITAYQKEWENSQQPGYHPQKSDYFDVDDGSGRWTEDQLDDNKTSELVVAKQTKECASLIVNITPCSASSATPDADIAASSSTPPNPTQKADGQGFGMFS
jgi:stage V sporulation protein G